MKVKIAIEAGKENFETVLDVPDAAYMLVKDNPVAFARFIGPRLPMGFVKKETVVKEKKPEAVHYGSGEAEGKEIPKAPVTKPVKTKVTKDMSSDQGAWTPDSAKGEEV